MGGKKGGTVKRLVGLFILHLFFFFFLLIVIFDIYFLFLSFINKKKYKYIYGCLVRGSVEGINT